MSLPSNVADPVRPLIHVDELGNLPLSAVMSAKAPAAMYFVISVLPISITSGVLPPASAASHLLTWSLQDWYCPSTVVPGCLLSNSALSAFTTFGQPDCASVCSQTVILLAAAWSLTFVRADAVEAASASVATTAAAAKRRTFIDGLPLTRSRACGCCALLRVAGRAATGRPIGFDPWAPARTFAPSSAGCQDQRAEKRSRCALAAVQLFLPSHRREGRAVR